MSTVIRPTQLVNALADAFGYVDAMSPSASLLALHKPAAPTLTYRVWRCPTCTGKPRLTRCATCHGTRCFLRTYAPA